MFWGHHEPDEKSGRDRVVRYYPTRRMAMRLVGYRYHRLPLAPSGCRAWMPTACRNGDNCAESNRLWDHQNKTKMTKKLPKSLHCGLLNGLKKDLKVKIGRPTKITSKSKPFLK